MVRKALHVAAIDLALVVWGGREEGGREGGREGVVGKAVHLTPVDLALVVPRGGGREGGREGGGEGGVGGTYRAWPGCRRACLRSSRDNPEKKMKDGGRK